VFVQIKRELDIRVGDEFFVEALDAVVVGGLRLRDERRT